jgi:hypothetical protein
MGLLQDKEWSSYATPRTGNFGPQRPPSSAPCIRTRHGSTRTVRRPASSHPGPHWLSAPGGRRSARLGESHLAYAVVTRGSDDKLVEKCIDGAHAAEQHVAQPSRATGHEGEAHELR